VVALKESHEKELSETHAALKALKADKSQLDDELAGLKGAHQVSRTRSAGCRVQ